jgi:hypothetical protein
MSYILMTKGLLILFFVLVFAMVIGIYASILWGQGFDKAILKLGRILIRSVKRLFGYKAEKPKITRNDLR